MSAGASQGVPLDSNAWASGFLPSHYQGVQFRADENPVLYVNHPKGTERRDRREMLDALTKLSATQQAESNDPEIGSRLSQYEMAYRMQTSVPEVADISAEPESGPEMYGPDVKRPGAFARNRLIARRLAERGVKYQTLFGMGWDLHFGIAGILPVRCRMVDQPAAALVKDLKQRGLLDDTLVIFGSEFGRTSFAQGQLNSKLWTGSPRRVFHVVACGRGRQSRLYTWGNRRLRLQHRQGPGSRPRSERDDPAHPRHRSHQVDVPIPGPRLPTHRRARQRREAGAGLSDSPMLSRRQLLSKLSGAAAAVVISPDLRASQQSEAPALAARRILDLHHH